MNANAPAFCIPSLVGNFPISTSRSKSAAHQLDYMMTATSIRPARVNEAEQLTQLVVAAKAHWGYSREQLEAWQTLLQVTAEHLRTRPAFVLERDRVVGFYTLRFRDGICELDNLWVSPDEVGKGHGRALLFHAIETARSMGAREILIDADPNAEAFYVRCGAVVTGSVPAAIDGQPNRVRPQLRIAIGP
jgi:N-acetylglutamate synthase-like GNAT family acetyltransferase